MMAGARFNSSNFIEMHPIQGAKASACFGVCHVNSVKGRWDQKWNLGARLLVPSKVLVLQATEAPQASLLSHALWIYFYA
jgi:hypothetical protein